MIKTKELTSKNFGKHQFDIKCQVGIIACVDKNQLIGYDGSIPWHYSADLKRFRNVTTNNIVVMGRKTYESIGKPLVNRENIIISNQSKQIPGTTVCTMSYFLENAKNLDNNKKVWIIGGAEIYEQALVLDICDVIDLTIINGIHISNPAHSLKTSHEKSVYFPKIPLNYTISHEETNSEESVLLHRTYKRIEW